MFKVGDLVVYGNSGVCTVEKVGPSELSGVSKDIDYYTLVPYYSNRSKILTPCNSDRIVLRAVISKDEAEKLINEIDLIEELSITDEKNRENIYKSVIRGCDCREIISIIKTIYFRKQKRLSEGKKVTASDEKYFGLAEDKLYGEFAVALNMDKDAVKEYIFPDCEKAQ